MRNQWLTLVYGVLLLLGPAGAAAAQDSGVQAGGAQQPSAREQMQRVHGPRSIDEELARLTKDLELTPEQQKQLRPLLEEHHDKIQALLDKNPNASRRELGPQIHAISDETHREIHELLSERQRQLEKAMRHRERNDEENRRPDPSATPDAPSGPDSPAPAGPSSLGA